MNHCRDMAISNFPRWRPAATHDGALALLNVQSNFVLIWLIVSKILKIQLFLRLAWNCLTAPTFGVFGGFDTLNKFFSSKPSKGTSLSEAASFEVQIVKIRSPVFAVGDDKKKRKGKESKGKVSQISGYISAICGADHLGPISTKIGSNHSVQFWFQYFQGFQIYRGSKSASSHWLSWLSLQQCCRYRAACDKDNKKFYYFTVVHNHQLSVL